MGDDAVYHQVYVRPNGASGEMGLVQNPTGQATYKYYFNIGR